MTLLPFTSVRSIYTKTVRSIRARAPMPENLYASKTPERLPDGSLAIDLKLKAPSTANCPVIPCRTGQVLQPNHNLNLQISNKNTLSKLANSMNLSRSFIISQQSPETKEKLRAEEQARIDKLSLRQKKGLLMRLDAPEVSFMENLFQVLHDTGLRYGVANDEFVSYRRYCTRKMHNLRSKHKITKDAAPSKELLTLLTFKCEWNWAQASLLRSQLHSQPRKRFHLRRVAKSCIQVCKKVESVASSVLAGQQLNAYLAYSNLLIASSKLDLEEIEAAYKHACKSKQLLAQLKDPFAAKKLEDAETLLRFIEYKAKGAGIDLSALQAQARVETLSTDLESTTLLPSSTSKPHTVHVAGSPVVLSPAVAKVKSVSKRLSISCKELAKAPNSENAELQVLYYEIQRCRSEFKTALGKFLKSYRQHDGFKGLTPLKRTLLRVQHARCKPEIEAEISNAMSLLNAFTSFYKGQIEDAEFVFKNFSQSSTHVVPNLNRLVDALEYLLKRSNQDQVSEDSSVQASSSMFSFARRFMAPAQPGEERKGIMGMFSSFFKRQ